LNNKVPCGRYDSATEAIDKAAPGAGVLILADNYPQSTTPVDASVFSTAASKNLRLYVEFPSMLPDMSLGAPRFLQTAGYESILERLVISSSFFSPALESMRIMTFYGCYLQPITVANPHIVAARVVGYDTAALGLPASTAPILFEHPDGDVLVATTKLSQFVTARCMPSEAWKAVWEGILDWLQPGAPTLSWTPTVRTQYDKNETLPGDALLQSIQKATQWYQDSQLLIDDSGMDWVYAKRTGIEPLPQGWVSGDGSNGILECYISKRIFLDGSQPPNPAVRADCSCESSMGLAFAGVLFNDSTKKQIATNMLNYIFFESEISQGPRSDSSNAAYGMLSHNTKSLSHYWGDDNARALLGTIASAALLKSNLWDDAVCRTTLANFRTTGLKGYHAGGLIDHSALVANGWQYYWGLDGTEFSPHYQSYIWAMYLWMYDKTGFEPLLQRTRTGIQLMMEAYPDKWLAECGRMDEERAHMLLPLAWLVRVDDTPEHRSWLMSMAQYVIDKMDTSGALPQAVDQPYTSNSQYGTGEAPIIYRTGDPATDMLYTMNFAFSGMNEAAAVTGDPDIAKAVDRIAEFLIRSQTKSESHPELEGTWYRSFDFDRWEYWGSDGDWGWGVWTTESGWTHSWITATLALRQMNTSLWDMTASSQVNADFDAIRKQMLPEEILGKNEIKSNVLAISKLQIK